jgi:hypothetical protein
MPFLDKLACRLGRQDEIPNQELARELVDTENMEGIQEIAANLWNKQSAIRADCIKVIYEIGALRPDLISNYAPDFIKLLVSRNNRMVWGAMYALAAISKIKADELVQAVPVIKKAMEQGSVITVDGGVKTLAGIASQNNEYQKEIVPYLMQHLTKCRTKEVPQHAESTLEAISGEFIDPFREVLFTRMKEMTTPQTQRIRRILKNLA